MMINALQLYSDISSRDRQLAEADEDRLLRRNLLAHELAFKQDSARREDAKLNMLRDNAQRNFLAQQMGMQSRERMMQQRMDMMRNRPAPQGAVLQTAEGIYERTPQGLVLLKDPSTGRPLTPKIGEKPVTEFQGKNALYGSRATMADRVLNSLEDNISQEGLAVKQSVQGMPVVGGVLGAMGNMMLSGNQQSVEQAQRNFVNAVLRQESGAVISDQEFENAKKQYFRQPGDSEQVVKQKRANRRAAIEGFKKIAGPAWSEAAQQDEAMTGGMTSAKPFDDPDKESRYQAWKAKQK